MPSAILYSTDYGQRLTANTYYSDIGDASGVKIKLKQNETGTTAELTATVDATDTTNYSVYADIASGWLATRTGYWIGQVEATFASAILTGEVFTLRIIAAPTT
jgi:hypothetical protein